MNDEDQALVAAVVLAVVQALKPLPFVNPAFYGITAIVVGFVTGGLIGYGRDGLPGIVPGMVSGMTAALIAGGAFGFIKAAAEYQSPSRQPRNVRSRFVEREDGE